MKRGAEASRPAGRGPAGAVAGAEGGPGTRWQEPAALLALRSQGQLPPGALSLLGEAGGQDTTSPRPWQTPEGAAPRHLCTYAPPHPSASLGGGRHSTGRPRSHGPAGAPDPQVCTNQPHALSLLTGPGGLAVSQELPRGPRWEARDSTRPPSCPPATWPRSPATCTRKAFPCPRGTPHICLG